MGQANPSCCCNGLHVTDDIRGKGRSEVSRESDALADADQYLLGETVEDQLPKDEVPAVSLCMSRQRNGDCSTAHEDVRVEQPEAEGQSDHHKGESSSAAPTVADSPSRKLQVSIQDNQTEGGDSTVHDGTGSRVGPLPLQNTPKKTMLRRNLTKQAAGHGGDNILKDWNCSETGIPTYIIKAYDETEANNYIAMQSNDEPLQRFTPHYDGEVEEDMQDSNEAWEGGDKAKSGTPQKYMRLSNLLLQFQRGPHVMDCKLGIRSFTEAEVSNKALRSDLYQKLKNLSPNELTQEEHQAEAITKHRWMVFNDNFTSLASLGFRIDGICHSRENGEVPKKELKTLRMTSDAARCIINNFLPTPRVPDEQRYRADVAELILGQLQELRTTMEESRFVHSHSLIGSSLLFVADAHGPRGDVFLIDFAKTKPVPDGIKIDHVSQWREGNHEDGIFIGVDNLIKVWTEVLASVRKEGKPSPKKFWPVRRLWR